MTVTTLARRAPATPPVGQLLREWRERRRISQLDLSIQADISARHLSFVETGRSRPTPGMILRRQILTGHEPYPALVVNRWWEMLDGNAAIAVLTEGCDPALLTPPVNALRASLHPDGMAPRIANLPEWRAHILERLHRQVQATRDPRAPRAHRRRGAAAPASRRSRVGILQHDRRGRRADGCDGRRGRDRVVLSGRCGDRQGAAGCSGQAIT